MAFPRSNIPFQDPYTGNSKSVVPDPQVVWSSVENWQGITAEAYRIETIETSEFQTVHHNVVLHLAEPAAVRLKVNGCTDSRTRVSGDLSFLPSGTVCQVESWAPHTVLLVSITQQLLNQSGFEERDSPPTGLAPQPHFIDQKIKHICKALKAEAESNYVSGPLYGESLGLALASCLLREYSHARGNSRLVGGLSPRAYRRVAEFIESDLAGPLNLQSLAELAGLSQFRFSHNFKTHTGLSPHQFVIRARLRRAMQLLRETGLPVTEVALAVGFQSSSRFNTLFKRELGATPSLFRRSFR